MEPYPQRNRLNSCYLNAVLNLLAAGPEAVRDTGELARQVLLCWTRRDEDPASRFFPLLHRHGWEIGRQHDVHELLLLILEDAAAPFPSQGLLGAPRTVHETPTQLLTASHVLCAAGHRGDETVGVHPVLTLAVSESIPTSLHEMMEPQHVEGFLCDRCGAKTRAALCKRIVRAPRLLFLHLSRLLSLCKIHQHCSFPLELALPVDSLGGDPFPCISYRLAAVTVHRGSTAGGHYITYYLYRDRWLCCDDTFITPVSWALVQQQEAYLLLYRRCA